MDANNDKDEIGHFFVLCTDVLEKIVTSKEACEVTYCQQVV
jgi:hypothetical protein